MAKEALFMILENNFDLEEVSVLDLFSGTGNISYEFASRGTKRIMLVEKDLRHYRFIRDTLRTLDMTEVEAVRSNAFVFLRHAAAAFDIVFADPPYDLAGVDELPDLVFEHGVLNPGGWFILEHSRNHDFQDHPHFLFLRKYGQVHFSVFRKEHNDHEGEEEN
jgi:16S rRNA (guanine(966)-N(2))-methyltransferase RsmD